MTQQVINTKSLRETWVCLSECNADQNYKYHRVLFGGNILDCLLKKTHILK